MLIILLIILIIEITSLFFSTIILNCKDDENKWRKLLILKYRGIKLIKGYLGCFVIIMTTLMGGIIILIYSDKSNIDLLGDYCSFLTFVGTFMVGFYVHKNDVDNKKNEKFNRCLNLQNIILTSYLSMRQLDNPTSQKRKIIYDKKWYKYMMEYLEISNNNNQLMEYYEALTNFFDCIDCINAELEKGKYEEAILIKNEYEEYQEYLPIKYNIFDILNDIGDFEIINEIVEKREDKSNFFGRVFGAKYIKIEELNQFIEDYYNVVEMLSYNEVIKKRQVNIYDINKKIINRFRSNEHLIKKISQKLGYYDYRMITHIIWEISYIISDQSKIIEEENGYYILKVNNK